MKMVLGLVVDFLNYKDHFKMFNEQYGLPALELHILLQNLEPENDFRNKLRSFLEFLQKNKVKHLSFHSPDSLMQTILYEEKTPFFANDKKKFFLLIDELKGFADSFGKEVILVVHQGIKLPSSMIDCMSEAECKELKQKLLKKAKESYDWLMDYAGNSKLKVMLENSPPSCASDNSYHYYDLAFEDISSRIGKNGFILDISHAAMCVHYYKQRKIKFPALELLRKEHKGIPPSLQSVEDYARIAAKNTRWIHLSDANGIMGQNEGLPIGARGSIIDFKKLFAAIKKGVKKPILVLEIVKAEKDFSLIEKSMQELKKMKIA